MHRRFAIGPLQKVTVKSKILLLVAAKQSQISPFILMSALLCISYISGRKARL